MNNSGKAAMVAAMTAILLMTAGCEEANMPGQRSSHQRAIPFWAVTTRAA